MMKGSFLIATSNAFLIDTGDPETSRPVLDDIVSEHTHTFIPKKLVMRTYKYDTIADHRRSPHNNVFGTGVCSMYYDHPHFYFGTDKIGCTCTAREYVEHNLNGDAPKGGTWDCTCPTLPNMLPLYEIVVKTNAAADAHKYVRYLVHPSEREHMERFLSGTDDAMYDMVHLLRYMPNGPEMVEAAERFHKRARGGGGQDV